MSDNTEYQNVIAESTEGWLWKLFVPKAMLRSLSGRTITGVAEKEGQPGRFAPTFADNQWLDKHFCIFVPKVAGIYNLTAWGVDGTADAVSPESVCVEVTEDNGVFSIAKLSYKDMLAHFGVDTTQAPTAQPTAMAMALADAGVTNA